MLVNRENTLNPGPDNRNRSVPPLVRSTQRMSPISLAPHTVRNPETRQFPPRLPGTIRSVRLQRCLVARKQPVALPAVVHIARRHRLAVHEIVLIHTHMNRVTPGAFMRPRLSRFT